MQIFVGLGNPGKKYERHRHNIGFMALDAIADAHGFSPWREKFQALIADGTLDGEKVLLVKPLTFMNLSGQSVGAALKFYKAAPEDVTVFHDELDLAPGKCRAKLAGGHAGHNGLRSLHQHIGPQYHRIRLGIGHPGHKDKVASYVLHDFARADHDWLDPLLEGIATAAPKLAMGDPAGFMNKVALKTQSTGAKPSPTKNTQTTKRPKDAQTSLAPDARTPLQKLLDKFK